MVADDSSRTKTQLAHSFTWSKLWSLDPEINFLNHGSFGACPIAVLEQQQALRAQIEREPVRFFALELEALLDTAREELAKFTGADSTNLVFVPNATTGINTVLRSLCLSTPNFPALQPGDELLTTDHEYNASRNALEMAAQISGAKVVVAPVPFPVDSAEQIVAAVLARVSSRTRLVLLDHVTSQTGLIFPLQSLIRNLTQQGIEVLIDGAHAPGMVRLDLEELGATYYSGNCHKWLCAPKGAAFLYVQPDRQERIRPLVISHGANSARTDRSRFHLEFDWVGTDDPTPYLCIPAAIQFMETLLPGGWPALMQHNHATVVQAREALCQTLGVHPPCPASMLGSMAVIPLPTGSPEQLQTALFHQKIEVPIIPWPRSPHRLIRISAQIYNSQADYDGLSTVLIQQIEAEQKGN